MKHLLLDFGSCYTCGVLKSRTLKSKEQNLNVTKHGAKKANNSKNMPEKSELVPFQLII